MFSNGLEAVVQMRNSEVRRENRHGIAENQVLTSVKDAFLFLGKMVQTEETRALVCVFLANVSQAALDPPGVVLETDGKTFAG